MTSTSLNVHCRSQDQNEPRRVNPLRLLTLIVDALAIDVDLLVEEFEESGREELKVLDIGLLRGSGGFGGFGLGDAECLAEIGVHGIIGLPLSLRRLDPVAQERFVLLAEREERRREMKKTSMAMHACIIMSRKERREQQQTKTNKDGRGQKDRKKDKERKTNERQKERMKKRENEIKRKE